MPAMPTILAPDAPIGIVGGGFSGTMLAINLLRSGHRNIVLIEQSADRLASGVAYSTSEDRHVLNVRAGNMSALPGVPDHFAQWLARREPDSGAGPVGFVSRRRYGAYLRQLLDAEMAAHPGCLSLCDGQVVALETGVAGPELRLADGHQVAVHSAVLAIGNLPPHDPPAIDVTSLPPDVYAPDPWRGDFTAGLAGQHDVAIIGTGLTAIDVILRLDAAGFAGGMLALSRRGLVPHAHGDAHGPRPLSVTRPSLRLSAATRALRASARTSGEWRTVIDALRPTTQLYWGALDAATRARFLRHLRPYWDVHRHRIAPVVADRIAALRASGRLRFAAGKPAAITTDGDGARLAWRARGTDSIRQDRFRRIINCTGPQGGRSVAVRRPVGHAFAR